MLSHPTLALLTDLGLHGMATAFKDLQSQPEARALDPLPRDYDCLASGSRGTVLG